MCTQDVDVIKWAVLHSEQTTELLQLQQAQEQDISLLCPVSSSFFLPCQLT
jgi:hypothetical protein